MSRPESQEIYQIAKMNMKLAPEAVRAGSRISHIEYECRSAFDMEFMVAMPCHVLSAARYRIDSGFWYRTGQIDTYDLLLIYEGSVAYRCRDTACVAGGGDVLYINASLPGELTQHSDAPLDIAVLRLSGLTPMHYYTLLTKNGQGAISLDSPEKLDSMLGKIVYYMKYPTNQNNVLLVDAMSGVFTELYLNRSGNMARDNYYNQPQWFIDTIRYIEEKSLADITISEIADVLGISESHFHKLFREYTGTTPYQYLLDLRISAAQTLLVTTDHQIKYIAYTIGFGSVNHFITHFKNATGCTPSEYRNMKQNTL